MADVTEDLRLPSLAQVKALIDLITASDVGAMANLGEITQEIFDDATYPTPYIGTVISLDGTPTTGQFRMIYLPYFANVEGYSLQVLFGAVTNSGLWWRQSHAKTWKGWENAFTTAGGTLTGELFLDMSGGNGANGKGTFCKYNSGTDWGTQILDSDADNNLLGIAIMAREHRIFLIDDSYQYNIFGEHNKTRGSYTGNGSATARQIDTGGLGNCALLFNANGSKPSFAILTPHGGFYKETNGTSLVGFVEGTANFTEGIINLATAIAIFNESGSRYYYQVL